MVVHLAHGSQRQSQVDIHIQRSKSAQGARSYPSQLYISVQQTHISHRNDLHSSLCQLTNPTFPSSIHLFSVYA